MKQCEKTSDKLFRLNSKIQNLLFYFIILFLPTQLGRHFWPDFAFISGLRIDYLSPTVYLTDILIFLLFVSALFNWLMKKPVGLISNIKSNSKKRFKISNYLKLGLLVLFLFVGIIFSKSPENGIYGLIKLFEFIFFGFYTANFIKNKKDLSHVIFLFSFPIIFESVLAILQFLNQGSLNGIFYFFGERMFNSQTPGIANASINGALIVRPYATFPHPNVLAGYLLIGMTLIILNLKIPPAGRAGQILNLDKMFFLIAIVFGTVALFLTLSRIAIFIWLLALILTSLNRLIKKETRVFYSLLIILLLLGIFLSPLHSRFTKINFFDESILIREDLISKSILMIKNHPIFGVGLNNFLINQINYQKVGEYPMVNFLQPVHNIYLLIASETGIVGLIFFLWFVFKTFSKISKLNKKFFISHLSFFIFSSVLFFGLFDHYFLTLQQGQLLFSFVFGLCWTRLKN